METTNHMFKSIFLFPISQSTRKTLADFAFSPTIIHKGRIPRKVKS